MSQGRTLNPQIVHDIAAILFWNLADKIGMEAATVAVIASGGSNLQVTSSFMTEYAPELPLPPSDLAEISGAVAAEALRYTRADATLYGTIYAEDAETARSPSAQDIQTDALKVIPQAINRSGSRIERLGTLCLRYPLPAVVFTDRPPHGQSFELENTEHALGYQLPMFLTYAETTRITDKLYVSKGLFQIPVPNAAAGDKWAKVIPNSMRVFKGVEFLSDEAQASIHFEW